MIRRETSRPAHLRFVVDNETSGQVYLQVLQFYPAVIIGPMLHNHLRLQIALARRAQGRNLGTFLKALLFRKSGSIG
jgi:hypothetical protein